MEIDLKSISKEDLIKLWEEANASCEGVDLTENDRFDMYTSWLESNCFGSDIMNALGSEIASAMYYAFRWGITNTVYDEENDCDIETKVTVDKDNPDVDAIFKWAWNGMREDTEYLESYGITTKKKPTKACPYTMDTIDWNMFVNKELLRDGSV